MWVLNFLNDVGEQIEIQGLYYYDLADQMNNHIKNIKNRPFKSQELSNIMRFFKRNQPVEIVEKAYGRPSAEYYKRLIKIEYKKHSIARPDTIYINRDTHSVICC